jgi:hypothetical protein
VLCRGKEEGREGEDKVGRGREKEWKGEKRKSVRDGVERQVEKRER